MRWPLCPPQELRRGRVTHVTAVTGSRSELALERWVIGVPPIRERALVASEDLAVLHLDRRWSYPAELAHERRQPLRVRLPLAIGF